MFGFGKTAAAFASCGALLGAAVVLQAASQQQVERGRYLVNQASMCIDCHTPMDAKGMPDRSRNMQGATLPFKPTIKVPDWADTAPALAGLAGYTDAQIVRALQTGVGPTGTALRPPMPQFRLSKEDAEAIVAYLKTLKPAAKR